MYTVIQDSQNVNEDYNISYFMLLIQCLIYCLLWASIPCVFCNFCTTCCDAPKGKCFSTNLVNLHNWNKTSCSFIGWPQNQRQLIKTGLFHCAKLYIFSVVLKLKLSHSWLAAGSQFITLLALFSIHISFLLKLCPVTSSYLHGLKDWAANTARLACTLHMPRLVPRLV